MLLLLRRGGDAVLDPLHIALDGRDGRAQVVGEVRHEQAPFLLGRSLRRSGGLEALPHALQSLGQLVQLLPGKGLPGLVGVGRDGVYGQEHHPAGVQRAAFE